MEGGNAKVCFLAVTCCSASVPRVQAKGMLCLCKGRVSCGPSHRGVMAKAATEIIPFEPGQVMLPRKIVW